MQWFEELQQVSFDHKYPARQDPTVTNSLKFKHEVPPCSRTKSNSTKSKSWRNSAL